MLFEHSAIILTCIENIFVFFLEWPLKTGIAVLSDLSSVAISSMMKMTNFVFLSSGCWCSAYLHHSAWVGMHRMIVAFPGQTHYLGPVRVILGPWV